MYKVVQGFSLEMSEVYGADCLDCLQKDLYTLDKIKDYIKIQNKLEKIKIMLDMCHWRVL